MTTTDAGRKLKAGEIDTDPPDYVVADPERHERIAVLFAAETARAERDADPEATYDRFVRIANGKVDSYTIETNDGTELVTGLSMNAASEWVRDCNWPSSDLVLRRETTP